MSFTAGDYRPRDAEHPVLSRVIEGHLDVFLETARRHADGASLPEFVEQEFRDFLTCGVLAHGFARLQCTDCAVERLVLFSCRAVASARAAAAGAPPNTPPGSSTRCGCASVCFWASSVTARADTGSATGGRDA